MNPTDNWFSDSALAKQRALEAKEASGEPITLDEMCGLFEPRTQPKPHELCTCCGGDARAELGGEAHAGKRWCSLCVCRGHHEEK